jgi:hypothetical protein
VQLGIDADKRRSWWWYLVGVHTRHGCDTTLVVVTPSATVARWARTPLTLGHPGATMTPVVLGPEEVPVVTDEARAVEAPELAVLSAIVHGDTEAGLAVGRAALAGVRALDDDHARLYTDIVFKRVGAEVRAALEGLMGIETYEYQSEFARRYVAKGREEGRQEGRQEGRAEAVLTVLDARGVALTADERAQVLACADVSTLDAWLRRAVMAKTAEDVLGG